MMTAPTRRRVAIVIGLTCALIWSVFVILPSMTGRAGVVDALENRLVDIRFALAGPRAVSPEVVIVAIDDSTLASGPLDGRQLLTRLIENIAQSGARALAVDVLLAKPDDKLDDQALADALARVPSFIAAAAVFNEGGEKSASVIWPQPIFRDAAYAGLVNLSTDTGGTPRYAPLMINIDGELHPSLPLLAAITATGAQASFSDTSLTLGDRSIPLDLGFNMPLRHSGPVGSVPTISATELLNAPLPAGLSDKVVVLGYTASAMGDRFQTPFDDSTPGVEIIATVISQLIGGATLRRDAQVRIWDAAHATVLTMLCVLALLAWPLSRALPVAVALLTVSLTGLLIVFSAGIWMSAALPLAAAVPAVLVTGALRYAQERQHANLSDRTVASLRRFQSPALAAKIERNPDYLAVPIERSLVILFVDLTGFTGLSQRLGPDGTRSLLQTFHARASEAIETRGGSVLNYMGDGAIAVFGLEGDAPHNPADSALDAAFGLARALSAQKLAELPDEQLGCRIGLHRGPATLSRMGVRNHQQVTVTGDSVNLASRLMEVAKEKEAVIVASGDFASTLESPELCASAEQAEVSIRGRAGRVRVMIWTQKVLGVSSCGNGTR